MQGSTAGQGLIGVGFAASLPDMTTMLYLGCWLLMAGQGALADPLTGLRGQPAIVEIPTVEDLGVPFPIPDGWAYLEAAADTVELLRARLTVAEGPALVYLDEHGNILHRDTSRMRRRRVAAGAAEATRRRADLILQLDRLLAAAESARERGKEREEVLAIGQLMELGIRGYSQVHTASAEWLRLDADRWRRGLEILAGEGIAPRARILADLKALVKKSPGLPSVGRLERARARLDRGITVEKLGRT